MRIISAIAVSLSVMIGMTSCSNNSSDLVTQQTLGHCLTFANDIEHRTQLFTYMSFAADYNYSNNTVDFSIVGAKLPNGSADGMPLPKMIFTGLTWVYNEYGWKVIDVENVRPEIVGMLDVPKFKSLKFELLDRFNGDDYAPGIIYEFEVESGESMILMTGCCMTGTTISTDPDGTEYCPEKDPQIQEKNWPSYWIDYDYRSHTADIYLYKAKFLSNMPQLNLVFPKVPFTAADGKIMLDCADLVPEYDGVPFKSFPISKLKGTVDFSAGMNLEFHCDYKGADFTVKVTAKY